MPGIFDAYFSALERDHQFVASETTVKGTGFLWSGTDFEYEHDDAQNSAQKARAVQREDIVMENCYERAKRIGDDILETLADELHWLNQRDHCVFCGVDFIRKQNLGTMRCTWHPDPGVNPNTYNCCGQSKRIYQHTGCQPCDHSTKFNGSTRWTAQNNTINVPLLIAMRLNLPARRYKVVHAKDPRAVKAVVQRVKEL